MRFHLSPEQVEIQETLKGALADAFPPDRLRALIDGEAEFDLASWTSLMALGVGGLAIPEAFGGSGLGLLDAAIAVEALGVGAVSGPLIPHLMTTLALARQPDAGLAAHWLPGLASGALVATAAFGGGWTPESWTVVEAEGRVRGEARFVQAAASAHLFLVGLAGDGLAIVEGGPNVRIEPLATSDRTRRLSRVVFEDAPAVRLAADAGRVFDAGLVLTAADALGGAQRLTDMSVDYAKTRHQFGQPIGRFQALKHQLATMAIEVESSRALVWFAAHAWDSELPEAPARGGDLQGSPGRPFRLRGPRGDRRARGPRLHLGLSGGRLAQALPLRPRLSRRSCGASRQGRGTAGLITPAAPCSLYSN